MVRQTMTAFVNEMVKMALAAPSLGKVLGNSPFSSSVLKPSTIKHTVPTVGAGRVSSIGKATGALASPLAPGVLGANIRKPTTIDPKMPLVQGTPPASPVHVAPQVNPQAATIRQGAPQTVNSAAPTAGGAGVPQAPAAQAGGRAQAPR